MNVHKRKGAIPKGAFVLIGAPDDRGVKIVGGRPGAKKGPDAIRRELSRMTVGAEGELEKVSLFDLGNLRLSSSQEKTYDALSRIVTRILKAGAFPLLLGGGHDLSFGGLRGFLNCYPDGGVISIDPHFDCRPQEKDGRFSSGTTFRHLFEAHKLKNGKFACFGFQTERNATDHFLYLKKRKALLIHREDASLRSFQKCLGLLSKKTKGVALSFDMDSIEAASAPGVSALNQNGLTPREALMFIREAAKNTKIKYFDVMEVNPTCDPDGRTARLAALLIYHFMLARKKS